MQLNGENIAWMLVDRMLVSALTTCVMLEKPLNLSALQTLNKDLLSHARALPS